MMAGKARCMSIEEEGVMVDFSRLGGSRNADVDGYLSYGWLAIVLCTLFLGVPAVY
jgi:hypothetical protein